MELTKGWRKGSSARADRRLLTGAGTGALVVAAHALWPDGAAGVATFLSAFFLASILAWVGVRHAPRHRRRPWTLLALGVALSTLGHVINDGYGWLGREVPDVSFADSFWLGSYIAVAGGLHLMNPRRARGVFDVDALVDALVAAVLAALLLWDAVLADLVSEQTLAPLSRAVSAGYPILDVVLLSLTIRLAIDRARTYTLSLTMLAAAVVVWLASDFGSLVADGPSAEGWIATGWMSAALLLGGSIAVGTKSAELEEAAAPSDVQPASRRMWLVIWPLIVPMLVSVQGYLEGEATNPIVLLLAMISLIALASIRAQRLIQEVEAAHTRTELSKQRHRAIAAHSADAVLILDGSGYVTEGSGDVQRLLGVDGEDLNDLHVTDALKGSEPGAVGDIISMVTHAPDAGLEVELQVQHPDGRDRWLATRVVNLLGDEAVSGIVMHLQDVTDKKRAEEELVHRAFHDSLTGLANRPLFVDRIEQALRRRERAGTAPSVLFLDIDGFKSVNDRFGHAAGDILLKEVGARLERATRGADTIGRLGGDEFAVLIEDSGRGDEAQGTAERILSSLTLPAELDGRLITVSASIGVALAGAEATATSLLRNADIAMYRAKAGGKARVVTFSAQMGDEAGEDLQLRTDLPDALERGQLELYYQPVIDLADQQVVGFEALIRWNHPTLGLLSPDRFIPLSETTGLIIPIGAWVLEEACTQAMRWQEHCGGRRNTMAVNLSARQLASDEVIDAVAHTLARTGLDPADLVLEITETTLIEDPLDAGRRLEALRRIGVQLAIDDFGTGFSSLSHLRQFPVDILKINRSFTQTITDDGGLPPIVRGLLDLGRTLGLTLVAEGIELDLQRRALTDEDCQLGQGFYFSRPLRAADAEDLLPTRGERVPESTGQGAEMAFPPVAR